MQQEDEGLTELKSIANFLEAFQNTTVHYEQLLDQLAAGAAAPTLVIGMPVGFVGVAESKRRLAVSGLAQVRLEGSRGGAGLVGAALNALLRAASSEFP